MAKPNYRQQKRQKELSRKSRQAEKLQRRTARPEGEDQPADAGAGTPAAAGGPMPAGQTSASEITSSMTPKHSS